MGVALTYVKSRQLCVHSRIKQEQEQTVIKQKKTALPS